MVTDFACNAKIKVRYRSKHCESVWGTFFVLVPRFPSKTGLMNKHIVKHIVSKVSKGANIVKHIVECRSMVILPADGDAVPGRSNLDISPES
jgi:hypothetical protein